MSDAREILARLAPHGIRLDAVSFGSNTLAALTPQDVAAAIGMAHIMPLEHALLRVRYCGDLTCWDELRRRWYLHVHDVGIRERWSRPSTEHPAWLVLSLTSLVEHCGAYKCARCDGVREVKIGSKIEVCPTCNGEGNRRPTQRHLGAMANMTHTTWLRLYNPLLATCKAELQGIEDRAIRIIGSKLRRYANA